MTLSRALIIGPSGQQKQVRGELLILGSQPMVASEDMTAPALVNVYDASGSSRARYANATAPGREASGYIVESVAAGDTVNVYPAGPLDGLSGLTAGMAFMATTDGQATNTPPSGAGNVVQLVGTVLSASVLNFNAGIAVDLR